MVQTEKETRQNTFALIRFGIQNVFGLWNNINTNEII